MNEHDLDASPGFGGDGPMEGLDPSLLGHFNDAARAPVRELDFLVAVESRIRRERRVRAVALGAFYVALVVIAVLLTPYVAAASLTVATAIGGWATQVGPMLLTPAGFGLSLLAGVWLLRRVGVLSR